MEARYAAYACRLPELSQVRPRARRPHVDANQQSRGPHKGARMSHEAQNLKFLQECADDALDEARHATPQTQEHYIRVAKTWRMLADDFRSSLNPG